MDIRISGSGSFAPGEYENIRISGSGRFSGLVRCSSYHVSGSSSGDALECANEIKVSGSSKFSQNVKAGTFSVSGSFSVGGNLTVKEKLSCSGSVKCGGNIKSTAISSSGSLSSEGDVEAETVKISGKLNCEGLLNAEDINIDSDGGMTIGSIGGSNIIICDSKNAKKAIRLPLFSSLVNKVVGVHVKNSIEGDTVAIENVKAPRVSGRVVAVGDGCEIELLQYSEKLEVSPNAKVGRTEKI